VLSPSFTIPTARPTTYVPRGANILRLIFHDHFHAFADVYDSLYAQDYGKFRLERISHVAERFESCGDYTKGIARIQCCNPECRLEYFRPFSCKGFYLCPSCSQKRTLLFAEYLDEQLLFTLPHRQFVFSIPKALRIFFRHDQKLFAAVSSLLFSLIRKFYRLAAGAPLLSTASIIAFQPFGDFLRPNAHWHCLVLEGGFAPDGRFLFLVESRDGAVPAKSKSVSISRSSNWTCGFAASSSRTGFTSSVRTPGYEELVQTDKPVPAVELVVGEPSCSSPLRLVPATEPPP